MTRIQRTGHTTTPPCLFGISCGVFQVPGQGLKEDAVMWADGFLLVLSLTDASSYQVVEELIHELRKIRYSGAPFCLVA